jgi:hypothetical protein
MNDTAESDAAAQRQRWSGAWKLKLAVPGLLLLLTAVAVAAPAPKAASPKFTTTDCLACHNDASLSKDVNGKAVSLYVNEKHFTDSIHGVLNCTDCHQDVKAVPHETPLAKPTCSTCHADQQATYDHSVHSQALSGLPRWGPRNPTRDRPQISRASQQHSGYLRRMPWPEIGDGTERPQPTDVRLV